MEPESSSGALREYFGDRKIPDISRKIKACVACRKQKIKCQYSSDNRPPCVRCRKRGLSCTVNRSLQTLLENDVDWKNSVVQRLVNLETAMSRVADNLSLQELHDLLNRKSPQIGTREATGDAEADESSSPPPQSSGPEERPWEIDIDAAGGPAAIPASHLAERSQAQNSPAKARSEPDGVVARGIITADRAQELFETYQNRFDHFLYRILGDHSTYESVKSASPLLLSAICAVSSLQTASDDFEKCYRAFLDACSARAFSKDCVTEDVQAYCIGAFWLSDMSWNLVGAAVRTATQLQLHRSIYKALEGDRLSYLRTRLFYLVYVCDHHFSIAHGRPPMTRSSDAVDSWRNFLRSKHASEDDARLVSQVEFWAISSRIQETMGTNVEVALSAELLPHVRRFIIELDTCRADWNERFAKNPYIGNYPKKGVGLHHHFAKLYLCSHVFRGRPTITCGVSPEVDEIANTAVLSATSILTSLAFDEEIQSYLDGLPSYFFTMITFTSVFLLKVALRYPDLPYIQQDEISALISQVVAALQSVSAKMHRRHLLTSIAYGLHKILARFPEYTRQQTQQSSVENNVSFQSNMDLMPYTESSWETSPSDIALWENYDFLSFQNVPSGYDFNMDFR